VAKRICRKAGRIAIASALAFLMAGCGLTQTVKDGAVDVTRTLFYRQVKILRLDFEPRSALNTDSDQTPHATMVRVYQLKERKTIDAANYQTLLNNADVVLKDDLLATKEVLVMPGGNVSMDMPIERKTQFVAVVALFYQPDVRNEKWRVVLSRDELDPDKPRKLELGDGWMNLLPLEK